MKKLMLIFLIIICSCGIGYLGYLIFQSKNIDKVELVGNIQTLYVVGDEIDYEDAKLKVTYKNGNIKMVDIDSSSVEIEFFSTSVETHGKMNILYKSAVLPIEYNVIQKGAYYLTDYKVNSLTSTGSLQTDSQSYDLDSTYEMVYIAGAGVCNYYTKELGEWYMVDGNYNKNYSYSIAGDTMTVKLNNITYNIKVTYVDSGIMQLNSTILTTIENSALVTQEMHKTFEHTDAIKTTQTVISAEMCYDKLVSGKDYVTFKVGDTLENSGQRAYLKVTYGQYSGGQFRTVYVKFANSMIIRNFDTSAKRPATTPALLTYAHIQNIQLQYEVI